MRLQEAITVPMASTTCQVNLPACRLLALQRRYETAKRLAQVQTTTRRKIRLRSESCRRATRAAAAGSPQMIRIHARTRSDQQNTFHTTMVRTGMLSCPRVTRKPTAAAINARPWRWCASKCPSGPEPIAAILTDHQEEFKHSRRY